MQATQCWSARPDVIVPIENLLHQIRDGFSLGLLNFRLIAFVVAGDVPSSYCSHVYFRSLSATLGRDQAIAIRTFTGQALYQVELTGETAGRSFRTVMEHGLVEVPTRSPKARSRCASVLSVGREMLLLPTLAVPEPCAL